MKSKDQLIITPAMKSPTRLSIIGLSIYADSSREFLIIIEMSYNFNSVLPKVKIDY